jgi:uncharacterized repeat protein (TIGR03803 family)
MAGFCFAQAQEKVIYSFGSFPNDGLNANGGLLLDKAGDIYGTTQDGGNGIYPSGTAFELIPQEDGSWAESIIYNFCSSLEQNGFCADGQRPMAGLIADGQGNLYGTTYYGGPKDFGVVFELSPPGNGGVWTLELLYSFGTTQQDGNGPAGRLTWDSSNNLYGTTQNTVFEMSPVVGGNWSLTPLFTFCGGVSDCPSGYGPVAGVSFDKAGNLYGTTEYGGFAGQWGILYKLSPPTSGNVWTEAVLDTFQPRSGGKPMSEVNFDAFGNLYLTTSTGEAGGICGSVDKYDAVTSQRQTYLFWAGGVGMDGCNPEAGVALNPETGTAYGSTFDGGSLGLGSIYRIAGSKATDLYSFGQDGGADGYYPTSSLTTDEHGNLYGVASAGGQYNHGVVFEITP